MTDKPRKYRCVRSFNVKVQNPFSNTNRMTCICRGETFVGEVVPWTLIGDCRLVADRDGAKFYMPERTLSEYFEEVCE